MTRYGRVDPRPSRVGMWMLILLCFTGCAGPIAGLYPPSPEDDPHSIPVIYVQSNGWHVNIVMPTDDLPGNLREPMRAWLATRQWHAPWIEFGWGDDGFYRSEAYESGITLAAALWPTPSVVHLWSIPEEPTRFYTDYEVSLYRVRLTRAGYDRLGDFLAEHLALDEQGLPQITQWPGLQGPTSAFVKANPAIRYHLFHTCNHWTAHALRSAGLPITPFYALTAGNVESQLRHGLKRWQNDLVVFRR